MTGGLRVGILDSGIGDDLAQSVVAGRSFRLDDAQDVAAAEVAPDRLGHGSAVARIIAGAAAEACFLDAQVFLSSFATTPAAVAAGIDWLVSQEVRVVNMSFGMRHDRAVLRRACGAANEAGLVLLAAAPARGPMVFPAGYAGVVKVSGDARCAPGEISTLGGAQADFGAHPRPLPGDARAGRSGGASFAVAHLCGILVEYLAAHPESGRDAVLGHLDSIASYHGPERRHAGAGP